MLIAAVLTLAVASTACGETTRPDGGKGLLAKGATAPDFEARDADNKPIRLSASLSSGAPPKLALVYFYPKDETPGCTKQACALRDSFTKFEQAGVAIFGVSRDSEESHRAFRKAHALPFPLVADESGAVQSAYGVPSPMPGIAARVSFLVDGQGKIAQVWSDVDPVLNAGEVLAAAKAVSAKAP
jgi:peroxiredoxin Q/BCP